MFDLFAGDMGPELLLDLWQKVGEWVQSDALDSEGLRRERIHDDVVLVWLPKPEGATECYATALILRGGEPTYLTLELSFDDQTVLGGWIRQGEDFAHANMGDGGKPAAFASRVREYLGHSKSNDTASE